MSEILRRREIILFISGIIGGLMIFEYFFIVPAARDAASIIRSWVVIISQFALILGVIAAFRVHASHIRRRTRGQWPFSLWLIVLTIFLVIAGLAVTPTGDVTPIHPYGWVFEYVWVSLDTTLYAITGFYIFSGAYRAFRARNIEAAILIVTGIVVMLRNAPIGGAIWSGFPIFGDWLQFQGQVPGMTALMVAGGIGLLAFGLRTLIGMERGYYGEVRAER